MSPLVFYGSEIFIDPIIFYIKISLRPVIIMKEPVKKILIATFVLLIFSSALFAQEITIDNIFDDLMSNDQKKIETSINYIRKNKPLKIIDMLRGFIIKNSENQKRKRAIDILKIYSKNEIITTWLKILEKTTDYKLKKRVINYISDLNDMRMIVPLAEQLKSPFYEVRKAAAIVLEKRGNDRIYPIIMGLAESPNPVHKIYSLEAMLYLYDKRFYPLLKNLLNEKNKSIRIYALKCILKNKLKDSIYMVRNIALSDDNNEVRVKAIETIGGFKDGKSLYVLLKTLRDIDKNIRYTTVKTLHSLNNKNSAYALSNQLYVEGVDNIKDLIIETLIRLKKQGDIKGLRKILLNDENPLLRIKSAYALGYLKEDRGISVLVKGLEDRDFRVRAEICYSLRNYKSRLVLQTLLETIRNDRKRYVRSSALYTIKKFNDKKAVIPLFDQFSMEKDPVFREILREILYWYIKKYV
ncbi:HEAT repeat domain-containing protein [Spirochaetota bacterium]